MPKIVDLATFTDSGVSAADWFLFYDTGTGVTYKLSADKMSGIIAATYAAGDVIYHDGTKFVRLGTGTSGQVLRMNAGATAPEWGAAYYYGHWRDEKANGTDGGTATAGSYAARTLNTEVANTISGASLSSNQVTLPAGTYEVSGRATGYYCGRFRAQIYNVTDAVSILKGITVDSADADEGQFAPVDGVFTIAASKVIEMRSRCSITRATDGFGRAASFGENEIYSELFLKKIG